MPIESVGIIEDSQGAPLRSAGVPGSGANKVDTITIGGTPSGGTFTLSFQGFTTTAIPWSSVNATLLAAIQSAFDAIPSLGTGNTVVAAGTLTAGVGTITVTYQGNRASLAIADVIAVVANNMTGGGTIAIAQTTAGVTAFGRAMPRGRLAINTATGILYINTSGTIVPTWAVVGTQT